eukprot:2747602-Amphidinium_carterae.1
MLHWLKHSLPGLCAVEIFNLVTQGSMSTQATSFGGFTSTPKSRNNEVSHASVQHAITQKSSVVRESTSAVVLYCLKHSGVLEVGNESALCHEDYLRIQGSLKQSKHSGVFLVFLAIVGLPLEDGSLAVLGENPIAIRIAILLHITRSLRVLRHIEALPLLHG